MQAHDVRRVYLNVHEPVVDGHPLVSDDPGGLVDDAHAAGVVVRVRVGELRALHGGQAWMTAAVEHVREQFTVDVPAQAFLHVPVGGLLPADGVDCGGDVLAFPPCEEQSGGLGLIDAVLMGEVSELGGQACAGDVLPRPFVASPSISAPFEIPVPRVVNHPVLALPAMVQVQPEQRFGLHRVQRFACPVVV